MTPRKIAVVGTGYVGLVTAACLAEIGHQVTALDIDDGKISLLRKGKIPIHEPGLEELVRKHAGKRLVFTGQYSEAISEAEVVMIAVGTPSDENGDADLSAIWDVADRIVDYLERFKVVAVKSTVPVGTCDELEARLWSKVARRYPGEPPERHVVVLSNPEFLREGRAVGDFMKADRVVIGGNDTHALELLKEIYVPLNVPLVICDRRSSEMIKYASNAFLATKISFINSIARLCEKVGADVVKVAEGMGYDHRIMPEHLRAGLGYGGSCFPKDTSALLRTAKRFGVDFELLQATVDVNEGQVRWVVEKLESLLGDLKDRVIAVWGLAFKPHTDDVRDAPSLKLIKMLVERGATVQAYDPVASVEALQKGFVLCGDQYASAAGAHALVLVTEWEEFRKADFARVKPVMRTPIVVDARNCLDPTELVAMGFTYTGIGRRPVGRREPARERHLMVNMGELS